MNNQTSRIANGSTLHSTTYDVPTTIRIRQVDNWFVFEINDARFEVPVTRDDVVEISNKLHKAAHKFLASAFPKDKMRVSPDFVERQLALLAEAGNRAYRDLFATDYVMDYVEQHIFENTEIKIINIVTENCFVPWELLCWRKPLQNDIHPLDNFWGFKYALSRQLMKVNDKKQTGSISLYFDDSPSIALFVDKSLPFAEKKEAGYLEHLGTRDLAKISRLADLTVRDLSGSNLKLSEYYQNVNADIVHFACHASSSNESHIQVTEKYRIPSQFFADTPIKNHPLIILNVCSGGIKDVLRTTGFVNAFNKAGVRGILTTEARIPDKFGYFFIRRFYRSILSGTMVSSSLHECRHYFMRKWNNPLGLIYSLYANPWLVLKRRSHQDV